MANQLAPAPPGEFIDVSEKVAELQRELIRSQAFLAQLEAARASSGYVGQACPRTAFANDADAEANGEKTANGSNGGSRNLKSRLARWFSLHTSRKVKEVEAATRQVSFTRVDIQFAPEAQGVEAPSRDEGVSASQQSAPALSRAASLRQRPTPSVSRALSLSNGSFSHGAGANGGALSPRRGEGPLSGHRVHPAFCSEQPAPPTPTSPTSPVSPAPVSGKASSWIPEASPATADGLRHAVTQSGDVGRRLSFQQTPALLPTALSGISFTSNRRASVGSYVMPTPPAEPARQLATTRGTLTRSFRYRDEVFATAPVINAPGGSASGGHTFLRENSRREQQAAPPPAITPPLPPLSPTSPAAASSCHPVWTAAAPGAAGAAAASTPTTTAANMALGTASSDFLSAARLRSRCLYTGEGGGSSAATSAFFSDPEDVCPGPGRVHALALAFDSTGGVTGGDGVYAGVAGTAVAAAAAAAAEEEDDDDEDDSDDPLLPGQLQAAPPVVPGNAGGSLPPLPPQHPHQHHYSNLHPHHPHHPHHHNYQQQQQQQGGPIWVLSAAPDQGAPPPASAARQSNPQMHALRPTAMSATGAEPGYLASGLVGAAAHLGSPPPHHAKSFTALRLTGIPEGAAPVGLSAARLASYRSARFSRVATLEGSAPVEANSGIMSTSPAKGGAAGGIGGMRALQAPVLGGRDRGARRRTWHSVTFDSGDEGEGL